MRAIARAAGRGCSRPGCTTPAAATLLFSHKEQVARLVELLDEHEPQAYDLCPAHADRTRPPMGWELTDTRPPPADAPRRLDDDETVAVLAAALRGETPPTRVEVLEGEGEGRDEADDATTATADPARPAQRPDTGVDQFEEDPLRAALEELQRVAVDGDEVTGLDATGEPVSPTPLRGADTPGADGDEPTLW